MPQSLRSKLPDSWKGKQAKLQYCLDDRPGIRRIKRGGSFSYLGPDKRIVRDAATLLRIQALRIPPAWTGVWIAPVPSAHLQATGRDKKGRKQYRYHSQFRRERDAGKYERVLTFGLALPKIRSRVAKDLKRPELDRTKVLALVVKLLETTLIRVGNEEYSRLNGSFGLTTMRDRHAKVAGANVRFSFTGKSGKAHQIELRDALLARMVKRCQDLPGQELFQYVDVHGRVRDVKSEDVNRYLREAGGKLFTAKDFRTWTATVLAARALKECKPCESKQGKKKQLTAAIEQVAKQLGNTPAICRSCYVHPLIVDAHLDGRLESLLRQKRAGRLRTRRRGLGPDEFAVLTMLERGIPVPSRRGAAPRN